MKGMKRSSTAGAMRAPRADPLRGIERKKQTAEPSDSEDDEDEDDDDDEDDDSEDEDEDKKDDEDEDDDFSNMSFEELVRLKREMGIKAFEKARKNAPTSSQRKNTESEREKDAPIEVTSKKPVSRFRQVIEGTAEKRRDPRFSNLHGHLSQDLFEKSYSFLDEYKEKELQMTRERVKKEKDAEVREELLKLMSTQQQDAALRGKEKEQKAVKSERLKKEREAVKMGKKPFYPKKSDEKREELAKKFHELKSAGRLEKFMEKRRKKNSNKEHRFMPSMRRGGD